MTSANLIYAFSFFFLICYNIVLVVDKDSITQLQCESCKDGTAGYALLIFSENFICLLLPLTAVFTLQLIMLIKAEKAHLRLTSP